MRNLNDLEKKVLDVLVKHPHCSEQGLVGMGTVLGDHFFGLEHGISVLVGSNNNQVMMSIPENDVEMRRLKFLTVITVFNILKYLTDEGLILVVGEQQNSIGIGEQYQEGNTSFIPDPISGYIAENLTKYVLVTEELKAIVVSNYRGVDDMRHQQTVYISVVALIVSILLGLYGVYNGYSTDKALDKRFEQLVDNERTNANNIVHAITSQRTGSTNHRPPLKKAVSISVGNGK